MDCTNANPNIKCSVNSCAYHNGQQEACTLKSIKVGCTTSNVSDCTSTECASFKLGDHGSSCGCK